VDKTELSQIRHHLGKTQWQMAQLLGAFLKALESFEQGWRNIPVHIERQALLLMAFKSFQNNRARRFQLSVCECAHPSSCLRREKRA